MMEKSIITDKCTYWSAIIMGFKRWTKQYPFTFYESLHLQHRFEKL